MAMTLSCDDTDAMNILSAKMAFAGIAELNKKGLKLP